MSLNRQHSFWGSLSPLGGLTGAGLLIMASARLSWAIIIAGSLFWVYGLTTFTFVFFASVLGDKFFPVTGRINLFACLAAFYGSIYLFMFWLLCPFAAFETFMLLLLVPLFCASSGIVEQIQSHTEKLIKDHSKQAKSSEGISLDISEYVSDAASQAASLAVLIIIFAIVREPLAYCSLTFPGSSHGMVKILQFKPGAFFPIGILSSSAGALLLLGFVVCLYQYNKNKTFPGRE